MKVGIFGQSVSGKDHPYINELFALLEKHGVPYSLYADLANHLDERVARHPFAIFSSSRELVSLDIDFMITLGGDGTILKAITLIRDSNIPVLGINLGRLGFLASIEKKYIASALEALVSGQYSIDSRTMVSLENGDELFDGIPFALNDFTLHKRDTSSMITIRSYVDGEFLNAYWADGIVVSTPTGSTGYSLSCGGPIIMPGSGNLIITPVAPHNLNARPFVLSDNCVISFEISGRTNNFLCSLDSRFAVIDDSYRLSVRKCAFPARLVNMKDYSYFQNIRQKLAWGIDKRN